MQKSKHIPIYDRLAGRQAALAVVGMGYVGLPVALGFARRFEVIGYDIDPRRIEALHRSSTGCGTLRLTASEEDLERAAFFVVTVATPVDEHKQPDLAQLQAATRTVARHLKPGDYVVYESTVYPGCTRAECIPLLEALSGLKAGEEFKVGYSPERINPNDPAHTFANTAKIVSACDDEAAAEVAGVYASAVTAGVHRASSLEVAEASKIVENVQRCVNIALMNELQGLFSQMGIDMDETIEMASTKWNFLRCRPGLVGGHCIPVDPHYLIASAARLGIELPVTASGCAVNDGMARRVVQSLLARTALGGRSRPPRALLMGVTYKENIDDIRNTQAVEIFRLLSRESLRVDAVDACADPDKMRDLYGIELSPAPRPPYDLIVVAVGHDRYRELDDAYFRSIASGPDALLADLAGLYKGRITSLDYWTL